MLGCLPLQCFRSNSSASKDIRSLQCRLPTVAPCAGIDYVVVDMTNLPQYDQTADAIQLRPFEVLCQVRSTLGALPMHSSAKAWQWGLPLRYVR